ncbi:MAG: T9SS type A sorting domain-containing protein, partial [Cytophagales bacterium]|nr:T9SS type A sorting domain-containing protein [Cytophagales bacterium]
GDGGIDNLTGLSGTGRYVRMYGTQRATAWGYSLFEFEVYGTLTAAPSVFEAENAVLTGVQVETGVGGFSGTGYVNGFDAAADKITFTVPQANANTATLSIRYGTPFGVKRNFVFVNGVNMGEIEFPAVTGWGTVNVPNVPLNAGNNTIEIRNSWGWFLVDRISIAPAGSARAEENASEAAAAHGFAVYPIPTSDVLYIQAPAGTSAMELSLTRTDGITVLKQQAPATGQAELDLRSVPAGIYILTITNGDTRKTRLIEKF